MVTLVLLPGMDGTGLLLTDFVSALGADVEARVMRYPTNEVLGYAGLEAMTRRSLPADRPFVLLGESFSGPIAISIAADAPSNLRGLILCGTFAHLPLPRVLKHVVRWLPVSGRPSVAWVGRFLLGRFLTPRLLTLLGEAMAEVSAPVRRTRLRALLDVDVRARLERISLPVLCLRGTEDRVVPRTACRIMVERLPRARVMEFAAPHGLLQTRPDEVAVEVRRFLNDCIDSTSRRNPHAPNGVRHVTAKPAT